MISSKVIKRLNAKFKSLTKAEQRVAIAKDVIAQIKANKYSIATGSYVGINNDYESEDDVQSNFDIVDCTCCALGACVMSLTRFNNKFTFGEVHKESLIVWKELVKFFSKKQILFIEYAFEGWNSYERSGIAAVTFNFDKDRYKSILQKCYEFCYRFEYSDDRLVGIMTNIIKNKGEFKP